MLISVLVAVSENNVIGREGNLPWHLSDDLRRFKRLTMGHHLVMGRKTFESIGRPLPGRTILVLTRQAGMHWEGVGTVRSFDQAREVAEAAGESELFVVGGGEIYRQTLAHARRLYITLVHAQVDGDTHFPELAWEQWELEEETACPANDRNTVASTFRVYHRREQAAKR
jgi:dihydrofolate reductase